MNKIIIFLLTFVLCHEFEAQSIDNNIVSFSGVAVNTKNDSVYILNSNKKKLRTIALDDANHFIDTSVYERGYYYLSDGDKEIELYLNSAFMFKIDLDFQGFSENIFFTGVGAIENSYLHKRSLLCKSLGNLYFGMDIYQFKETEFLKKNDSIFNLQFDLLNSVRSQIDPYFYWLEKNFITFDKLDRIAQYEGLHGLIGNNRSFRVSDNFVDPFIDIELNNVELLRVKNYIPFVESYLRKLADSLWYLDEAKDYSLIYAKLIETHISNSQIQQVIAINVGLNDLVRTSELEVLYQLIMKYITNETKVSEINEVYTKIKKVQIGSKTTDLILFDSEGGEVRLTDFEGKLIYIDIWASWCLPCIKEFSQLNELKNKLHNEDIVFMNICMNDSEKNWRRTIEQEKVAGINLFAPNANIDFFNDYAVESLPRFILIDKEGKIIDPNAKRPSDANLLNELMLYLK